MKKNLQRILSLIAVISVTLSAIYLPASARGTTQWYNYRNTSDNIGIVTGNTPSSPKKTLLDWSLALRNSADWNKYVSEPLIINDNINIVVGGEILVIGIDGKIIKRAALAATNEYTCRPVYTDGMIIIPLEKGRFQAINASTLASIWVTDPLPVYNDGKSDYPHQAISTLTVQGEYVYTGTACADWTSSFYGKFLCINAKTGATVWTHENTKSGYYWAGAVYINGVMVVASDDGNLVSLDAKTGTVVSTLSLVGGSRSTVVKSGSNVYLTTKDGAINKISVATDGKLSDAKKLSFSASSTCTPAVYDGRIYVGGSQANYSGVLAVINAETLALIKLIPAPSDVKSAPLISKTDSGVFAYYTSNTKPGGVYVVNAANKTSEVLFAPTGDADNYCTASVISNGKNLYYTNDSGFLFSLSAKSDSIPDKPTPITVKSVTVSKTKLTLIHGKTLSLKPTVSPSNAANKKLYYTSNNKSTATVSSTGKITAKNVGKAVITAKTTNGKHVNVTVTVNPKNIKNFSVKRVGKKATFKITKADKQYFTNIVYRKKSKKPYKSLATVKGKTYSKKLSKGTYEFNSRSYIKVKGTKYYSNYTVKCSVKIK